MNSWLKIFLSTARNMWLNKLRSFLTILGIIVGISSVMILLSVGESVQKFIEQTFTDNFEANVLFVTPGESSGGSFTASISGFFKDNEKTLLLNLNEDIAFSSARGTDIKETTYLNKNITALIQIVDLDFYRVVSRKIIEGRNFNQNDFYSNAPVAIIDKDTAKNYFGLGSALNREINIDGRDFVIIGVTESAGTSIFGQGEAISVINLTTNGYESAFGVLPQTDVVLLRVKEGVDINKVSKNIEKRYKDDFPTSSGITVQKQTDILSSITSVTSLITTFLAVIASISLIVAGIGVMNIMLVSVKERIKEIGLRKALGAKNKDIFTQFVIESMSFTTIGGIIGIFLGVNVSGIIQGLASLPNTVSINAVFGSLTVSVVVGGVFGIFPALQASRLSPMEALRSE